MGSQQAPPTDLSWHGEPTHLHQGMWDLVTPPFLSPPPHPREGGRHFDKKAQEILGAEENFLQVILELLQL